MITIEKSVNLSIALFCNEFSNAFYESCNASPMIIS